MWLPADKRASTNFSFSNDTIKRETPEGPIELNVQCNAVFAVALMSTRVFFTAARAEYYAWSLIDGNLKALPAARPILADRDMPVNDMLMDELLAAHSADLVGKTPLSPIPNRLCSFPEHSAQSEPRVGMS